MHNKMNVFLTDFILNIVMEQRKNFVINTLKVTVIDITDLL